jgi:hypothetical protein
MFHKDRSDEKVVRAMLEKEDQEKVSTSQRDRTLGNSVSGKQKGFVAVNSVDTATSSAQRSSSGQFVSSSHSSGGPASGCATCACVYLNGFVCFHMSKVQHYSVYVLVFVRV